MTLRLLIVAPDGSVTVRLVRMVPVAKSWSAWFWRRVFETRLWLRN